MDKLVLDSPAKLNLYLEVFSKRKDNFHNLRTIFERIDLQDTVILKSRPDKKIKLTCNNAKIPQGASNLAYRAAHLLQKMHKVNQGVQMRIIKRIPVGSGLGGGSSNAASVLMGLNKIWRLGLKKDKLIALAQKIGSDVPFFIYNRPFALGQRRGDRVKPLKKLNCLRLWHILVVPKIKVLTFSVYKKWDEAMQNLKTPLDRRGILNNRGHLTGLTRTSDDVKMLISGLKKYPSFLNSRPGFNSLEAVTAKLYPQVRRIRKKLTQLGAKSILMSGSGPAVFGIVSSRKEAVSLCRRLKKQNRSWQVFVVRTY